MQLTTVPLSFAIPAALAPAVQQAARGEAGFLAECGASIADRRVTTIVLRSGRGGS
jgi:hypothetical protein